MKLLANSTYGYQFMDRSRHTLTIYTNDEKTHAADSIKLFKNLNPENNALYEMELAKAEIEHEEPILVGSFLRQYSKPRRL